MSMSLPACTLQRNVLGKALTVTTAHQHTTATCLASLRPFSSHEGGAKRVQKAKKKEKRSAAAQQTRGRDKSLELVLAALDAPSLKPPPASADEMQRRYNVGRAYNIGTFNRHNQLNHDLSCKVRLKQHAVNMLPRNYLRDAALNITNEGPPKWRRIPTDTPPIPDFDPTIFLEEKE